MAAVESNNHRLVLITFGDRATGALLHAVRRFMGKGVPDLSGAAVGATDHKRVAPGVIQTLQTALRTIALHDPHSFLAQTRAQRIDGRPGLGLHRGTRCQGHNAKRGSDKTAQQAESHPVLTEDNSNVNHKGSKRITQTGARDDQM